VTVRAALAARVKKWPKEHKKPKQNMESTIHLELVSREAALAACDVNQ